jgi:probable DNA metabolism protein
MLDGPNLNQTVVVDGTTEGLLTAVYKYYYENLRPTMVVDGSLPSFQQSFDTDYIFIETDQQMSGKVFDAMQTKLGFDTRGRIGMAMLNCDPDKMFDIYKYILLAFKDPKNVDVREQLDFVLSVRYLARKVGREAHWLTGFTRFRQTAQGIMYADISPKHNVLSLVCDHFTDRLNNERFIVHDVKRSLAGVYDTNECVIVEMPKNTQTHFDEDADEQSWQELWTMFYNTLGIQERKNSKLRIQMHPKYFWKHMTEHKRREPWT